MHPIGRKPGSTLPCRTGRFGGLLALALLAILGLLASDASAKDPTFSRFDVPTVFYIAKSDDRNRVDYGIHLDDHCVPTRDEAVFQYWREFENSPPVRIHGLGMFENIVYGISRQQTVSKTPTGGAQVITLRQFDKKPIRIVTKKDADGRCSAQARAIINGKDRELIYVYVKLGKGGLTPSVDYVGVHGKDGDTALDVEERLPK
jgi:hypothetical protein